MAKPLGFLVPLDGHGPTLHLRPGDNIKVCKGEITTVTASALFTTLTIAAHYLPREDYAASIEVGGRSVVLTDLTTNAAIRVHDGKKTISGKELRGGVSLRDGMVVEFGSRHYQFNRAKRVRL